jgi:hypothetical protein
MKKMVLAGTLLVLLLSACSPSVPPASQADGVSTMVAGTMQALTAAAPAVTATPLPNNVSVSFQNVSFVIPQGLATGATSELVPLADENNSDPWSIAPAHILFKLTGYPAPAGSFDAVLRVYPAQGYAAVNSWADGSLKRLQAVLASPNMPLTNDNLPTVPFLGAAAQQYAAQAKLITFNGGTGVRMISQYAQYPGPIIKDGSFYHYEGLTSDGKYMVAILFPVTLPIKATAENPSADSIQYPDLAIAKPEEISKYYQSITDLLNAAGTDSFQPSLAQLDALVQSIKITP